MVERSGKGQGIWVNRLVYIGMIERNGEGQGAMKAWQNWPT